MPPPNLTQSQKEKLKRLEPQLKLAVAEKNLGIAKTVVFDIQNILKPTGHLTRLVQIKNWLYELAIDVTEYSFAESGLIGNRKLVNANTRAYIESTSLLAICYLRSNNFDKAKPLIQEVLTNQKVIVSEKTRQEFRKNIIERFDEESVLYSLKSEGNEKISDR